MAGVINFNDARALLDRSRQAQQRQQQGNRKLTPSTQKDLQKVLESEHPLYKKYKTIWKCLQDWYLGENMDNYIFRHQREKEPHWEARRKRMYYFNYVNSIVNLISSYIFSKPVTRQWESPEDREDRIRQIRDQQIAEETQRQSEEQQVSEQKMMQGLQVPPPDPTKIPEELVEARVQQIVDIESNDLEDLNNFWTDIDMRGTNINEFMLMVESLTQIYGFVDVFMDMNDVAPEMSVETEQDRIDLGLRPYAFVILPLDLLNWEIGADGRLNWVRWREEIVGNIGPFEERNTKTSWRYYTWTKENWYIHEIIYEKGSNQATVSEAGSGENPLGEIPITRFYDQKHLVDAYIGLSPMKDIGKINVEILNVCSLIDEEMYQKSLNILVMERTSDRKGSVEIGNNNVLMWEGEHAPFYLAPSGEPSRFMEELIKMCIQEIHRLAKVGGDTGVQEAQSGIAYTWEFNQTNRMLSDKADSLERGETQLHRYWAQWMGLEWKGYIDYPDSFNVERFEEELKNIVDVKKAVRSQEFKRLMEKRIANRVLTKVPSIQRARVMAEIDVRPEEKQDFYPFPQ